MRPRWRKLVWIGPLAILGILVFVFLGGQIVMHLWNWMLPGLFGWRAITFWQALGLLVLCRILFGGFHGHGGGRHRMRERMEARAVERWEKMTPEEREKARERWGRCGASKYEPPDAKPTA